METQEINKAIFDPMKRTLEINLLKYAAGQNIFCPYCETIMDYKTTVIFGSKACCTKCFDKAKPEFDKLTNGQSGLEILDARKYFPEKKIPAKPKAIGKVNVWQNAWNKGKGAFVKTMVQNDYFSAFECNGVKFVCNQCGEEWTGLFNVTIWAIGYTIGQTKSLKNAVNVAKKIMEQNPDFLKRMKDKEIINQ